MITHRPMQKGGDDVRRLYVDKSTGTFADQLVAFGLAVCVRDLLRRAYDRRNLDVVLHDEGGTYRLDLDAPLDDAAIERLSGPYMPAQVIRTVKNAAGLPADLPENFVVDYEEERERRNHFFQRMKALSPEGRKAWSRKQPHPEAEALRALAPHGHWDIFQFIITSNPQGHISYNKLMFRWWAVQNCLPDVVRLLRDLYSECPNDLARAETTWKELNKIHGWGIEPRLNVVQIYNPSRGKGQNRTKADRLVMDNVKDFWLQEWLKAVGFYSAAITKQLRNAKNRRITKDRKTYVLAPIELGLNEHERVFDIFAESMQAAETAVRSDIFASLRYTRALLQHAQKEEGQSVQARLLRLKRARNAVSGFAGAFYKDLGKVPTTMNMPFLGLPGWLQIESPQDIVEIQKVLREHEAIVRQFDESRGDDQRLLLAYRDFCSGEDLEAFFEFTVSYSGFIIGRRERNQYARQFSEENLGRLIMGTDRKLEPILNTPGFRNIAYAIRQSTVTAQFRKKQGDRRYDVRYGLGQQLARKAHYADDFIAELSDFMHRYNAENAQVMETRPGLYRRNLRTSDIEDIVRLIDEYGSRTVCNLLIAYGYARSSAERTEKDATLEDAPEITDMADMAAEDDESTGDDEDA